MFCVFELPKPNFLQFQYDFRSFSDEKGLLRGEGGGGGQHGGRNGRKFPV